MTGKDVDRLDSAEIAKKARRFERAGYQVERAERLELLADTIQSDVEVKINVRAEAELRFGPTTLTLNASQKRIVASWLREEWQRCRVDAAEILIEEGL